MSCKAKKNKQEEFHVAFICCQIRRAFCLKCSYIMAEMPIGGGFSQHPWPWPLPSLTGFTPLSWDHFAFSFAQSWIFPSPVKGKAMFAQWFVLQQGQAAQTANQPCCAVGQLQRWGDPPKLGGTWHHPGVIPPWLWNPAQGAGICRTTPCSHPWPHSTHCAFPMQDTHRKVMLWLFGVTPDLHHHHSQFRDSYRSGICIGSTWLVSGDKEQDLGLYYGVIILIMISA